MPWHRGAATARGRPQRQRPYRSRASTSCSGSATRGGGEGSATTDTVSATVLNTRTSWSPASSTTSSPSSPTDNVKAGSLYLAHLLRETGGDPTMAAAAYYQGLSSVRRIGMLPETQRYVANVMALRSRFGG